MNLQEFFKAQKLNKYYAGVKGQTLVEAMFPATYTNNFDVSILKGINNGAVEVLQISELDADPLARDWGIKAHSKEDKEFFREKMSLNEKQRKELFEILNTKDEDLIKNYTKQLYEQFAGKTGFLASVRALATYTAAQLLATGKVTYLLGNGSGKEIDYKLDNKFKETLTGAALWNTATSKPIEDLQRWKEVLLDTGKNVEIALMSENTYKLLRNHQTVKEILERQKIFPSPENIKKAIEEMSELKIIVWKDKISVNGVVKKAFPDNVVTLIPNGQLGTMEYGPTPTKTDKLYGLLGNRDVVDITDTYATLEVAPVSKSSVVNNVDIVIETLALPNPTIIDAMFIANVA